MGNTENMLQESFIKDSTEQWFSTGGTVTEKQVHSYSNRYMHVYSNSGLFSLTETTTYTSF